MNFKQLLHHLNRRDTRLFPKISLPLKIIFISTFIFSLIFTFKTSFAQNDNNDNKNNDFEEFPIQIDTSQITQKYDNKQEAFTVGNNQESWIYESLTSNLMAISNEIGGTVVFSELKKGIIWKPSGLIGVTKNAIVALYHPPASGVQYIAQSVNNFLGKPTLAAASKDKVGFGFYSLNGIQEVWKKSRNLIYSLISLFFIITGIMIMLRIKISPQATITLQSTIPKIISTLILVTFSYAIVGLIIDFSYVILGLAISIYAEKDGTIGIAGYGLPKLMSLDLMSYYEIIKQAIDVGAISFLSFTVGGLFGAFAMISGNWIIGILGLVGIGCIFFIFIFIQLFKLFFGLAKVYINLLIRIILGPLEIGMGAIPGSKLNFSSWLNEIIADVAVFPITVIFTILVFLISNAIGDRNANWAPVILPDGYILKAIIGLVGLSIIAKLPNIVPEFFFNIKPSPFAKASEEGIGGFYKGASKRLITSGKTSVAGFADKYGGHIDPSTGGLIAAPSGIRGFIGKRLSGFVKTKGSSSHL